MPSAEESHAGASAANGSTSPSTHQKSTKNKKGGHEDDQATSESARPAKRQSTSTSSPKAQSSKDATSSPTCESDELKAQIAELKDQLANQQQLSKIVQTVGEDALDEEKERSRKLEREVHLMRANQATLVADNAAFQTEVERHTRNVSDVERQISQKDREIASLNKQADKDSKRYNRVRDEKAGFYQELLRAQMTLEDRQKEHKDNLHSMTKARNAFRIALGKEGWSEDELRRGKKFDRLACEATHGEADDGHKFSQKDVDRACEKCAGASLEAKRTRVANEPSSIAIYAQTEPGVKFDQNAVDYACEMYCLQMLSDHHSKNPKSRADFVRRAKRVCKKNHIAIPRWLEEADESAPLRQ